MAELLCSKFIDKKTDLNKLTSIFSGIKMQIGFFNPKFFFDFDHQSFIRTLMENNIQIQSIHGPTIDVFQEKDFFRMLNLIKKEYPQIDNITLHPSSGNPLDAFKIFKRIEDTLYSYQISILYENFDSSKKNKRWLPRARKIYTVPIKNIFLTYDTSHVKIGTDIISDLEEFKPRLGMIHLSNKKKGANHLPVFEGDHDLEPVLEWIKNKYPSFVVLEYHDNDAKLIEDYNRLKKFGIANY